MTPEWRKLAISYNFHCVVSCKSVVLVQTHAPWDAEMGLGGPPIRDGNGSPRRWICPEALPILSRLGGFRCCTDAPHAHALESRQASDTSCEHVGELEHDKSC